MLGVGHPTPGKSIRLSLSTALESHRDSLSQLSCLQIKPKAYYLLFYQHKILWVNLFVTPAPFFRSLLRSHA